MGKSATGRPDEREVVPFSRAVGNYSKVVMLVSGRYRGTHLNRRLSDALLAEPQAQGFFVRAGKGHGVYRDDLPEFHELVDEKIASVTRQIDDELAVSGGGPCGSGSRASVGGDGPRRRAGPYAGTRHAGRHMDTGPDDDRVLTLCEINLKYDIPVGHMDRYAREPRYADIIGQPLPTGDGSGLYGFPESRVRALKRELDRHNIHQT